MKATVTTPSGIKLYYQDEPKRLYKVNGKLVPSVTEILGVLDKPALVWWGMKIGVEGLCFLYNNGVPIERKLDDIDVEGLVKLLTEHKLTVNHVRDKAGVRGTSAHDVLEQYANGCIHLKEYPEEEKGYVKGVLKFLDDARPGVEYSELMVGSAEHGFAGRFDLLGPQEEREVVIRNLKKSVKKEILPPGRYLWDLKTTKYVYDTHHLQLAAYEGGLRECGYGKADHRAIVLVAGDGTYEVHRSPDPNYKNFLAVREAHRAMRSFRKGRK